MKILPNDTYHVAELRSDGLVIYATTVHVSQLKSWRIMREADDEVQPEGNRPSRRGRPPSRKPFNAGSLLENDRYPRGSKTMSLVGPNPVLLLVVFVFFKHKCYIHYYYHYMFCFFSLLYTYILFYRVMDCLMFFCDMYYV